jgi:hypothetical protein
VEILHFSTAENFFFESQKKRIGFFGGEIILARNVVFSKKCNNSFYFLKS